MDTRLHSRISPLTSRASTAPLRSPAIATLRLSANCMMLCERDESAFAEVAATVRWVAPASIRPFTVSTSSACTSFRPTTTTCSGWGQRVQGSGSDTDGPPLQRMSLVPCEESGWGESLPPTPPLVVPRAMSLVPTLM